MQDGTISTSDLARQFGVSREWVYDRLRSGEIPCVVAKGEQHGLHQDLDDWLERQRFKPRPGC